MTAMLIVAGLVLLLPGICAWYFIQARMPNTLADAGLVVSGLGIAIIRALADEFELGGREGGQGARLRFMKLLSE